MKHYLQAFVLGIAIIILFGAIYFNRNSTDSESDIQLSDVDKKSIKYAKKVEVENQIPISSLNQNGRAAVTKQYDAYLPIIQDTPPLFYDTPMGMELSKLFFLMNQLGQDAESNFTLALNAIKKKPDLASNALIEAYKYLGESRQTDKYRIMYILGLLELESNIDFLVQEAASPLPESEDSSADLKKYESELLIKIRAVSGLRMLAEKGNAEARQYLLNLVQSTNDITLKTEAAQAYLYSGEGGDKDKEMLAAILPEKLKYVVVERSDNDGKYLESIARKATEEVNNFKFE